MRNFPLVQRTTPQEVAKGIHVSHPLIISGGIQDWPSRERWTFERLLREFGSWLVPVSVFHRDFLFPNKKMCRISDVIPKIFPFPSWPLHYLQQIPLTEWPRSLVEGLGHPPGLTLGTPADIYFWCGPHGASSPLHYDTRDNLHVLMQGYKRFLLFPPEQSSFMYPCPEQEIRHLSEIDVEEVDWQTFPMFRRARGLRCVLGPGDVLYLPKNWWHQVHLWAPSIAVNFWIE
jgi:hypothetical protein